MPLLKLVNKLNRKLNSNNEFFKRIKYRHTTFWLNGNDKDNISHRVQYATDSVEEWKDVENWQRKLSNKHNSREFAIKFGCRVPYLYWQGRNFNSIPFDTLPDNYVIRPTTGAGGKMVFVMQKGLNLFDGHTYAPQQIIDVLSVAAAKKPDLEFLIEEFVTNEKGEFKIPDDYKLYMFNGKVACIQVINRQSPSKGRVQFYDENWGNLKRVQFSYENGERQDPPKCLPEMLEYAKRISKEYQIFARIDFYATHNGAVFGEITPTPFQGKGFTFFGNKLLIKYWDTYCKGLI
ncbi:hypothetical protein H9Q13_07230 [Pontibacter sp. JH31]|uniref:ATP-grasp domain-containing protein n=1 Tax=Pontibacter aquaedesilientis TaxID=2766980 RepID=A0ABR7XF82_9BACT|nr:ATP-grasp fold amidoligase family protein [Pontibacter aquaedesilientis]MBD1396952.1 hypothetical protein [Pontibacter aquaedesilientis]